MSEKEKANMQDRTCSENDVLVTKWLNKKQGKDNDLWMSAAGDHSINVGLIKIIIPRD
jgi:hypothetical protein